MTIRRAIGLLVVLLAVLGAVSLASAQGTQGLHVRGVVDDDCLVVALRDVFPALGFTTDWDADSQSLILRSARGTLRVTAGSATATWYPAATGEPVKTPIARPAETVSGTMVGPLTSLLRAATIPFTVLEHTESLTRMVVMGKSLTVQHGGKAPSSPAPQPQPRPQPQPAAPSRPPLPRPTDPNLTSRAIKGETPQLIMRNESSREVTVSLMKDDVQLLWKLPPDSTLPARSIDAGTWAFRASAPGVRSSTGERTFDPSTEYTWKWWVQ